MKVTEVKFTRRYNVGQYEHEEYTVTAQLDDDSVVDALSELKSDVQKAYAGEASEPGQDTDEETGTSKRGKKGKKSKQQSTTAPSEDDTEAEDEETEDAGGEETEEDSEETEESESEDSDDEESEEETEEEPPAKKGRSNAGAKVSKGKSFKKKPQAYQRSNETHKDIFSGVLKKVAPNWKKSFESKAHAKKVSQKLEGKEFLDESGKVLASFEAEAKKAMGKFAK